MQVRERRRGAVDDRDRALVEHRKKHEGLNYQNQRDDCKRAGRKFPFGTRHEKRQGEQDAEHDLDTIERVKDDHADAQAQRNRDIRRGEFERRFHKRNRTDRAEPDERNRNL